MNEYTLYLDETYTYKGKGKYPAFAIGGFIVKDSDIESINKKVDTLKILLWGDLPNPKGVILHELDLKDALDRRVGIDKLKSEYKRFRRNSNKATILYKEMSKIIKNSNIYTIGCVLNQDDYNSNFPKEIGNDQALVCMQIILENYTHFLYKNDAIGKIVYESRGVMDKTMLMRFYQVSSIGTMYVKPESIQHRIKQICFIEKKKNLNCLQVADFIPNQIARKKSGKTIKKNVINLTNNIILKSYDGTTGNFDRYGIKVIPRMN